MDTAPLTLFAQKVSGRNRLLFADLRRLERDVLPNGITSRAEAEILLELDDIGRLDPGWRAFLTDTVVNFVVTISEPPTVAAEVAEWLVAALAKARPSTAADIVRAVERRGRELDESLEALLPRARRGASQAREPA
jgi:hypothetical protein